MTPRDFQQCNRQARRFRRLTVTSAVAVVAAGLVWVGGSPAHAAASCNGKTATIEATADGQTITGTPGADVIWIGAFRDVVVNAGDGDDLICSAETGGKGAVIDAGAGDDEVWVAWDARVEGGEGDDELVGSEGYYDEVGEPAKAFLGRLRGGPGDDQIRISGGQAYGGPGDDHMLASEAGELHGGDGADVLTMFVDNEDPNLTLAQSGHFIMEGDDGDDVVELASQWDEGGYYPSCYLWLCMSKSVGGGGKDTLSLVHTYGNARVNLASGAVSYGRGTDSSAVGFENVIGSGRADVIRGSGKANRLDGRGGNDKLYGLGGNDVLIGGAGRDAAYGGPGKDRCVAERRTSC